MRANKAEDVLHTNLPAHRRQSEVASDGRERGQYNCPYHFGVTYQAAIINGKPLCKHLKQKVDK